MDYGNYTIVVNSEIYIWVNNEFHFSFSFLLMIKVHILKQEKEKGYYDLSNVIFHKCMKLNK
jgi:hypothetical protein